MNSMRRYPGFYVIRSFRDTGLKLGMRAGISRAQQLSDSDSQSGIPHVNLAG